MPPQAIKVLLVEDEPDMLDMARQFLEAVGGFEVHACGSGSEALAALRAGKYDAVVSDYRMPGMDGLELLRAVRALFGRLPFILFTGRGREEVVIDALNSGADFYQEKGGDPAATFPELARKVQQAVGRRKAEEALRDIEERFRRISDNTTDGIWMVDMDLNLTYVSQSIVAHLGYSEAELKSMTLADHLTPDSYQRALRALREELTPERLSNPALRISLVIELEFRHADGSTHRSEEKITLIRDAGGGPLGLLGVGRDISEGRTPEKDRSVGPAPPLALSAVGPAPAGEAEVGRKMGILNDITRHDILNQLTVIGLTVALLKQQARDERTLRSLEMMENAAENIQQQLRFSREYERVGSSAPCWQSLDAATRDALRAATDREVTVVTSLGGWELFADPMLGKVFANLVDNSLRHGGKVRRIAVEAAREGGDLVVCYTDDGVGIAEQDKAGLFTKGHGKNTGLGLFMVQEILDITGIQISEDGVPGKGARFRVRAPPGKYRRGAAAS